MVAYISDSMCCVSDILDGTTRKETEKEVMIYLVVYGVDQRMCPSPEAK